MPSAKVPQCPWPVRKKTNSCGGQARLRPPSPPETSLLRRHHPLQACAPGSSGGCSDSAEPPEGPRGSLFPLESPHLQTPAPSRLPRGWRAAEQVPKVLWPGTRRTGNSTCRASSRAAEGSGAVPGPRQSAPGAGRPAAAAPGLPAPTAPAQPAALAPARGVPAPRRPRPRPPPAASCT